MAGAIQVLESANPGPFKDLLYQLELGMLLRLDSRYEESQKSWKAAAERVQPAEQSLEDEAVNLLQSASSYLVTTGCAPTRGMTTRRSCCLLISRSTTSRWGTSTRRAWAIKQTPRARGADRGGARQGARRGRGEGEKARRAHHLQGAERLSGRGDRQPRGQRAEKQLSERAFALSRRLRLRGARRGEPRGARLPAGERASDPTSRCSRKRCASSTGASARPTTAGPTCCS